MGNMLLRGIVCHHGRRIKIMKADGTVMKLRSAVSVKEILVDYPDHQIYEAAAGPRLGIGSFTEPLPERERVVAGHLYYLIPLPQDKVIHYNNNRNSIPGRFTRPPPDYSIPASRLQPEACADIGGDSIKPEEADDHVLNRGGVRIVSSSYSTDGSTVRVKVQLRKEDLASFLSALIQGATRQSTWTPRLHTVAEPHCPDGDL